MKNKITKIQRKRIIKLMLIILGFLVISLSFFFNTPSINQNNSDNNVLPSNKGNNLLVNNNNNIFGTVRTTSAYPELFLSQENNNHNRNITFIIITIDASGTSSINNDMKLIIYSTCTFLAIIILSEIGIVLKRRRDNSADVQIDDFPPINSTGIKSLESQEKIVLDAVEDYFSENKPFDKDAIIRFIISRFAKTDIVYNKNGIDQILQSLIDKKIIIEGSKLLRNDVLLNQNRAKIFNCVMNHPGIPFMEIVRALNMSNFIVKWHLDVLQKFDFIRTRNIDNRDAYFDSNFKSDNDHLMHFLSRPKYRNVIDYLKINDGATKHELSKELSMHPITISKYIKNLEECGILSGSKYSNKTLFFLKENYFDYLA